MAHAQRARVTGGAVSLGHLLPFQEALCPGGRHYLTLRRGPSEGWSGPCMDGAHLEGHVGGHERPRAVSPNTRYLRACVLLSTRARTHTHAHACMDTHTRTHAHMHARHMDAAQGSWSTAPWIDHRMREVTFNTYTHQRTCIQNT